MNRTYLQLLGGWAYPADALAPLARLLSADAEAPHPFTAEPGDVMRQPGILVGWSLGALRILASYPLLKDNVTAMILIGGTARFCAAGEYRHGTDRAVLRSMITGLGRDRDRTLSTFYELAASPATDARDTPCTHSDAELREGLTALDRLDARTVLASVNVPVLLLHGRNDRIVPYSASEFLSEQLPRAELHLHPEAGHELPLRETDWAAGKIDVFLGKL